MSDADRAARFARDGYVELPGLLDNAAAAALAAAVEVAPEHDGGDNPLSLGAMRFASNLFPGSQGIRDFLLSPTVTALVTELLGPDTWVRWDQVVWKRPGAPEFPLHQDNGYSGLAEPHLQLWVALTPMTRDNGGLLVVPGSHHRLLEHRWVGSHVVCDAPAPPVAVDARPGDAIAFSSFTPHATAPNTTDQARLAYIAEFLPTSVPDPGVPTPYLLITEGGTRSGRIVPTLPGPVASPPSPARRLGRRRRARR